MSAIIALILINDILRMNGIWGMQLYIIRKVTTISDKNKRIWDSEWIAKKIMSSAK